MFICLPDLLGTKSYSKLGCGVSAQIRGYRSFRIYTNYYWLLIRLPVHIILSYHYTPLPLPSTFYPHLHLHYAFLCLHLCHHLLLHCPHRHHYSIQVYASLLPPYPRDPRSRLTLRLQT